MDREVGWGIALYVIFPILHLLKSLFWPLYYHKRSFLLSKFSFLRIDACLFAVFQRSDDAIDDFKEISNEEKVV